MTVKKSAPKRPAPAKSVDGYLAALPADQRRALTKLRAQIKAAAPEAIATISYGLPTYKTGVLLKELERYDTSGKDTIRFTPDKPLPATLVTKLVKARVRRLSARR